MKSHRDILFRKSKKCYICGQTGNTIDHIIPQHFKKYVGEKVFDIKNKKVCCALCNNKLSMMQGCVKELMQPSETSNIKKLARNIINFCNSDFGRLALFKRQLCK